SGFGDSRLAASAATAAASATPATRVRPSFISGCVGCTSPDARVLVLLHMAVSSGCPGVTGWSTDSVSAGGYPVIIQANMDGLYGRSYSFPWQPRSSDAPTQPERCGPVRRRGRSRRFSRRRAETRHVGLVAERLHAPPGKRPGPAPAQPHHPQRHPTSAGARLLERLRPALEEINAAFNDLDDESQRPVGTLKLNVPVPVARHLLPELLERFLKRYPGVNVEVVMENTFIDVIGAGYDAGVRYEESLAKDMIAVPIGPRRQRFVAAASPAYLAAHGTPRHPSELTEHQLIGHRFENGKVGIFEFEKD